MDRPEHVAKRWVEASYPSASGDLKAMLITAYGAGLDEGLKEAQDLIAGLLKSGRPGEADRG